jgi:predicted nucleic acid-binding protein
MIVIDTSAWIPYLQEVGSSTAAILVKAVSSGKVLMLDLILLELLQGVRDDRAALRIERQLADFAVRPVLDASIARIAARNYRHLRGLGITVRKTPDLIIATYCIEHGHGLVHRDHDFDHFERHLGLAVLR